MKTRHWRIASATASLICIAYFVALKISDHGPLIDFALIWLSAALAFTLFAFDGERIGDTLGRTLFRRKGVRRFCGLFALFFITISLAFLVLICAPPGAKDTGGKEIEYLVVLGGGIRENGEPSVTLKSRLDRAAEYMRANPSVTVLVTGGKGEKEPWTEAETMARYLESKAEKPHSPILEERAALNTIENFTFSKKMIADREKEIHPERDIACDPPSVLVITNESHLNRALFLARREGYADVSGIPVPTPPVAAPNNYLREVGSYWKFLIRSLLKVFIPSI